jgi:hypothetical protein
VKLSPLAQSVFDTVPNEWGPMQFSGRVRRTVDALVGRDLIQLRRWTGEWRRTPPKDDEKQAFYQFMRCVHSARKRAGRRGMEAELTLEMARALWARCGGRCELTGIAFDFTPGGRHERRPFAPSLDRRDSSRGYTQENVRVVCVAVNLAMNQWGEAVLLKVARGLLSNFPGSSPERVARDNSTMKTVGVADGTRNQAPGTPCVP